MMRFTTTPLLLASALGLSVCKSELDNKPAAGVKEVSHPVAAPSPKAKSAKTLAIQVDQSKVGFVGVKVTGDHEGSFGDVSGTVTVADNQPKVITIAVKTESLTIEPEDLQKHLKSADFFDVAKYPESSFVSTKITPKPGADTTHEIEGNLTLHGESKAITFPAKIEVSGDQASGKAQFKINRKDFGIVYPGMPDDLIKDDVLLKLEFVARP